VKTGRIFVGAAAAAGLVVLASRIGLRDAAAHARNLGVALPILLTAGFARLLIQTQAWQTALRSEGVTAPYWRLVGVRLASQAAGYLTVGPAASEPVKLAMLRDCGGMEATAPATLIETGAYWLTTVILGFAGAFAAAALASKPRLAWTGAALFGGALALLTTRRSVLTPLIRALGARAPRWLRSAENAELRIRSFRERRPAAARTVLILDGAAQTIALLEVAAVLWAAGIRCSAAQVLAIESAARLVKTLGAFIPARLGSDEGGSAAAFALLGFAPAAGLMLAVARRARDLLFSAAGIAWAASSGAGRERAAASADLMALQLVEER
jgi:hypothetical protein